MEKNPKPQTRNSTANATKTPVYKTRSTTFASKQTENKSIEATLARKSVEKNLKQTQSSTTNNATKKSEKKTNAKVSSIESHKKIARRNSNGEGVHPEESTIDE